MKISIVPLLLVFAFLFADVVVGQEHQGEEHSSEKTETAYEEGHHENERPEKKHMEGNDHDDEEEGEHSSENEKHQ